MFSIRKINPLARSIGTMGAIAALVGGVTFAALQSNTVALSPNTLTSATAALQIGSNTETFATTVAGITSTLTPGVASDPFTFYLKNNGGAPLAVTANVPTDVSASQIPASQITLAFDCGGGPVSFTLAEWAAGSAVIPGGSLGAGNTWTCTETATLNASYGGAGGQTVTPYTVNFVGNQS